MTHAESLSSPGEGLPPLSSPCGGSFDVGDRGASPAAAEGCCPPAASAKALLKRSCRRLSVIASSTMSAPVAVESVHSCYLPTKKKRSRF